MPSTTLKKTFAYVIEKAINKALTYDSATYQRLKIFEGKNFCINCTSPAFKFYLVINTGNQTTTELRPVVSIVYENEIEKAPDISITGSWKDMLRLLHEKNTTLANSQVRIEGNIALLTELQSILESLDIDWEAPIVEIFGPVLGHTIAQKVLSTASFVKQQALILPEQIQAFITDEIRLVPAKFEIDTFVEDVSELKTNTDRLEAKIEQYRHHLRQQAKTSPDLK